jgi:mono/diheme cytochrome c family protein
MFGEYCGSCHGVHSSNSLAGPGFMGLYRTHQPKPSDSAMRAIIASGKGKMPPFGSLSSVQIDELIAYLKTL